MKDLGTAKQILGMRISRDRRQKKLWLSQEVYVEKAVKRFNMDNAKPLSTPLVAHLKLSQEDCPKNSEEQNEMQNTPYTSPVGSLMYAMVCTRSHCSCSWDN